MADAAHRCHWPHLHQHPTRQERQEQIGVEDPFNMITTAGESD